MPTKKFWLWVAIITLEVWVATDEIIIYKYRSVLKDAKAEIELIGNFCADSIPPRVLENGRSSEKGRD